ncbi:MAG: polyphosphate kinase 1 [Flavobacteriales bacterium]
MKYINREISWLKFNERVLQEAENKNVPLVERLRFLGIYSNNLDEFYKVRYATVRRAVLFGNKNSYRNIIENQTADELLKEINQEVSKQTVKFDETYTNILKKLESENVFIINEETILEAHRSFLDNFYHTKLAYSFDVLILDDITDFPALKDEWFYLAVKIHREDKKINKYALIEVPTNKFNRFIELPEINHKKYLIYLEDIIRIYLNNIFSAYEDVGKIEAHSIKITRDAKLSIDNDLRKSFLEKMERSVKKRKKGDPVRMVYDKTIAPDTLEYLRTQMNLDNYDNFSPGGRYHNRRDLMKFPTLDQKLVYGNIIFEKRTLELAEKQNYFEAITEKDHMILTPYDDYLTLIRFLRSVAMDPKVRVIKFTVYRVADESEIMNALINAARNGKKVKVLVELQARFDEAHNMKWVHKLQDAGASVYYGIPGLKVHSKIAYIERDSSKSAKRFAIVSTGNFHEGTANVYTDYTLLTANKNITKEVGKVFDFFDKNYDFYNFKHLIVSPKQTRKSLVKLIDEEIEAARKGLKSEIQIKVNSLCDRQMIDKLYEASQEGVKIRLIVRGICSIIAGEKDLGKNIQIISVIDKFLEHSRIYWFYANGKEKLYISSADLMPRNIDHRVEVTCPIYDKDIKTEIMDTFNLFFKDNTKARLLNEEQNNTFVENKNKKIRVQFELIDKLKNKKQNEL